MIPYKLQVAILHIDMTTPNFTGDGQQKIFEDLICSLDLTPGLHTCISVLNSVTAFLGNALIVIALKVVAVALRKVVSYKRIQIQ